ncbi:MAG: dinitrogenase iron-molybdenum cofactor [Epsilonproteobacteria bacterium]|nr:dinitrogenase iron-molybdenum cofactor [Campylobacterota bacterium]
MKIVVAVDSDKKTIVTRTGQCSYFAIYEDEKLLELIPNAHHDGGHHHHQHHDHEEHTNSHKKDVQNLKGCDIILVRAVGENMKEALESIGLKIKKIRKKDGESADEVIHNFLEGKIE